MGSNLKDSNSLKTLIIDSYQYFKKNIKNIVKLESNEELKDYSFMSSWGAYSTTGSNVSYSSYEQLQSNIVLGSRFIHLNLYFNDKREPTVNGKIEQSTDNPTGLSFEKCCKIIRAYGFENENLASYPMFLYLDLMYDNFHIDVSNQIANSIKHNFGDIYPDTKYSYAKKNLAKEKIDNFKGKIIIVINHGEEEKPRDDGYALRELTHSYVKIYKYLPQKNDDSNSIIALQPNDVKHSYNAQDFNFKDTNDLDRLIILLPQDNNGIYNRFSELYNFEILQFAKYKIHFIPFKFLPITNNDMPNSAYIKPLLMKYLLSYNSNHYTPVKLFN
tara:strand:- start:605 stop:1594 length:990 start_codon:yes stop_codon:yes gene_type:complete